VRTVNGESLSEIAIHNFEKNRKIKIYVLPYGRETSTKLVPRSTTAESVIETPVHSAWTESVWPSLAQFHPLATVTGKVSAAEVTDQNSDRHSRIFKGSEFTFDPMEKSNGYLDRRKMESVYIYSSTL